MMNKSNDNRSIIRKRKSPLSNEGLVYPGRYVPLAEKEVLVKKIKMSAMNNDRLPVSIEEFENSFKMDVIIPGVYREDIFVSATNNVLTIVIVPGIVEIGRKQKKIWMHEFKEKRIKKDILLPANADVEFINAQYNNGILSFHIAKANSPIKIQASQITVY